MIDLITAVAAGIALVFVLFPFACVMVLLSRAFALFINRLDDKIAGEKQ